ncbi:hypothetical protein ROLI_044970 [Roseobacter fucihabitans]|uniref:Replication protein n=1 Tax=Roseobacter fucihabitans TaxID=1537242 RepID=A0ABZ2C062_9RHOB|nr:helix-turn-helix domain-containing protein [Roseobacter litoralis]MBC6967568.1 hypothetical protein [Roseobacter litoralis]
MSDKEKSLGELALISTANFKSILPINSTQTTLLWQGRLKAMSGMALIWAANVKGLKPAAKIILILLADFHNKDTGQCNPNAQGLTDECEMGRTTLFRYMTTLEQCGLVTRHARDDGNGGRGSNRYELHLDIILDPISRPKGGSSGSNGVVPQNETRRNVSKNAGKKFQR